MGDCAGWYNRQNATGILARLALGGWFVLTGSSAAWAITIRHDKTESDYTNLATDPKWAAGGVYTSNSTCSASGGTLIHPEWAISAAHCVNSTADFVLGADRSNPDVQVPVASIKRHPGYAGVTSVGNGKDIGLTRLGSPILGVTPMRIYRLGQEIGQTATVIGYGRFGTGLTGDNMGGIGIRRAGQNRVDGFGGAIGVSNQVMLTDFDNPINPNDSFLGPSTPLEFEGGIAFYDSGSGWFADIEGVTYLIGVTSFRTSSDGNTNSDYGDVFGGTRVSREAIWIDDEHDLTMFWKQTQTGDWGTGTAWEINMEPGATNAAVIDAGHAMITQAGEEAEYTFLVGSGQLTLGNTLTTSNFMLRESGTLNIDMPTGAATIDGEYAQSAGTLSIDIGGTTIGDYDQLAVTGAAELGGDLAVTPQAAFGSAAARGQMDTFTLLTAASIQSTFDTPTFNDMPLSGTMAYVGEAGDGRDGMFASIRYNADSVEVDSYFALLGDANGDGSVNGEDFVIWNTYKFTAGTDWTQGDFNNDGMTDGQDFVLWNNHKFTSVSDDLNRFAPVPEPSLAIWMLLPLVALRGRRRTRSPSTGR